MLSLGNEVWMWAIHLLRLLSSVPVGPGPWCIVPYLSVGVREDPMHAYRFAAITPYSPQTRFPSSAVGGTAGLIVALVRPNINELDSFKFWCWRSELW